MIEQQRPSGHVDTGHPRLARGIVWSLLVEEMERERVAAEGAPGAPGPVTVLPRHREAWTSEERPRDEAA